MKQAIGYDAIKLTTSKIITLAISMIIAMLLSRFRTLEEYGTYSQLLLVINLVTTIFMLGLPNSINFFLARAESNEEKRSFLSVYYSLSTILSLFTGLILVLSIPLIVDYFRNPLIKGFFYVLAVYPWTKIILSSIENVLIVYGKTNQLMLFRVLNSISLLFIVFIVELLNLDFKTYMILFVVVEAIFSLAVYLIVQNISGRIRISFDRLVIKKIFNYSIPIGLASVVGMLNVELDKLVIGKFFSVEEVAIYTNAAREMPVTIVASSLTAVLMPHLARLLKRNQNQEAVDLWKDTIYISYTVISFISIGIFTFAPEVISLLYSDKYLPGLEVFRIYSLVLLLRFTYFGIILNSIGKTKFIFYSSLVSLGLNFVLNYLFYNIFGFIGPAIATFISILAIQLLQLIVTSKSINIRFTQLFPWKALGMITLINIVMGIIFAYIKKVIPIELYIGEVLESILLGVLWGCVYMFIMIKRVKQKWNNLNKIDYSQTHKV